MSEPSAPPMTKIVNGVVMPMTESEIDETKALWARSKREVPLREKMAQSPSEAALTDPDLMQLWGAIHSVWDEIEGSMLWIFSSLTDADTHQARTIFYSVKTHAGRRDLIENIAVRNHYLSGYEDEFKRAMKRIKARAGDRNKLIHGYWGWKADLAELTVELARFTTAPDMFDNEFLSRSELMTIRDKMISTRGDVAALTQKLVNDSGRRFAQKVHDHMHLAQARSGQ